MMTMPIIDYKMDVEPTIEKIKEWVKSVHYNLYQAGDTANTTILRFSQPVAPKLTGKLRRTVRKDVLGTSTGVVAHVIYHAVNKNDGFVYSYIQELNPDGRFKYYTTPGTHDRYLQSGFMKAIPELEKIFDKMMKGGI